MASENNGQDSWQTLPNIRDPSSRNDYELHQFISHDSNNRRQSSNWKKLSILVGCSVLQLPIWGT